LNAAIEASPAGVLVLSADGKVELANAAARRMFPNDSAEHDAPKTWRTYHLDGSECPMHELPLVRALREGKTISGDTLLLEHADGRQVWTEGHAAPVIDERGNIVAASGVVIDVTPRHLAEQLAERFQLMAEASPDFIGIATPEGVTVYVNPGGLALCGLSPDADVRGNPIAVYHPHAVAERVLRDGVPAALRDGLWTSETALLTRDGEEIPVSQVLMAHRNRAGKVIYLSTVMRDLRKIRRLEAQLFHSQKLEALGRLAGGIAHDFNNMLFVIHNCVELTLETLPPEHPGRTDLQLSLDATARATTLCSQLLGFARKQVVSPRVVRVNDLLLELRSFIAQVLGEHVTLTTSLAQDLWNVRIDPAQFEQIVTNLCINARDAQPRGGAIIIETQNIFLDEAYVAELPDVQAGRYVMIAVSDQGQGMPPEVLERAFEPFFTTKDPAKGTGLGLATVHGAVKQNGGHITAYSELGRGTTIKVFLPATDDATIRLESSSRATEARATETVLVVEDEAMVRGLTVRLLESAGYRVLEAASARRALDLARDFEGPIHLLVSDVIMPNMSGADLAEELSRSRPDTKVLFVSGYTDQAVARHGVLAEGVEFLSKPFGRETLLDRVHKILHGSTA
jgi:PAS domain S-box-containing protein